MKRYLVIILVAFAIYFGIRYFQNRQPQDGIVRVNIDGEEYTFSGMVFGILPTNAPYSLLRGSPTIKIPRATQVKFTYYITSNEQQRKKNIEQYTSNHLRFLPSFYVIWYIKTDDPLGIIKTKKINIRPQSLIEGLHLDITPQDGSFSITKGGVLDISATGDTWIEFDNITDKKIIGRFGGTATKIRALQPDKKITITGSFDVPIELRFKY